VGKRAVPPPSKEKPGAPLPPPLDEARAQTKTKDEEKHLWMHCEVCKRQFEPGALHCPFDGSRLKPFREISHQNAKGGLICPVCRRGYPKNFVQCPDDNAYLIPYSVFRSSKSGDKATKEKAKICPVCQATYHEDDMFCVHDGAKLEPIQ
jgi:hypothetical protein